MKTLRIVGAICLGVLVWAVLTNVFSIPKYILPNPLDVWREIAKDAFGLGKHFLLTFFESLFGLVIAWAIATIAAFLLFIVKRLEETILPLIVGFKAVPLVALAPLFILWFGNGFISKTVMAATICFFPLVIGYLRGFRACTDDEILLLRNLELSRAEELLRFRLLKATPFWLAGLRVSSVLAVIGAIVAEFTGANAGLGYIVLVSSVRIDTPLLMVGILLSALCGITLHGLTSMIEVVVLQRTHMDPTPE